jgi:Fe-S-cluster-containing hydrogenase component 2
MCIDVCPTNVFVFDEEKRLCMVDHAEDCIACLTCAYVCPSGAITHDNYHLVKNWLSSILCGYQYFIIALQVPSSSTTSCDERWCRKVDKFAGDQVGHGD